MRKIREQIIWRLVIPLRTLYWKLLLTHLGSRSKVLGRISVPMPQHVFIGDACTLNDGVTILAYEPITIGNYVRISAGVIIASAGLDYRAPMEKRGHKGKPIVVEDGVWIGANAVITAGVRIGKNAVIGAGAVVISDVPEDHLALGVPARIQAKSTQDSIA